MSSKRSVRIEPATLAFLRDLDKHNDRDWFFANKARYNTALDNMRCFVDALIERMQRHDRISTGTAKESLMRIYNDQRFHKDRPPYKARFAGGLGRVKPELRGGYFYRIQPGGSFIACGFFGPAPLDLKRIRTDILHDHATWKRLLHGKSLRKNFGDLVGDQVPTVPRGYPKDHPAIDLLRRKQYLLRHAFTDREVLSPGFLKEAEAQYRSVRPFFDHMSEVLTTDENGRSVLGKKR